MKKGKKIILILLCSILAVCTVSTAGVLIWKKTAEKTPVPEEVLVDGGEASVSDEATLRELLLKEEELVITLTEDITVDESLVVKGKKTLLGTRSIRMALYVMPYENLITVAENSSLILDGVTVNGNGIANGVKVEKSANLTLLSGEVAWGNPYGIEVQGNAEIKGGSITDAIHTGIFIGTSGNVQMSAGNVKSAGYASTRISKGGYFGFGGDAILQNCGVYHIHNSGTSDVTGGVVRDSEYTLATTDGELNINYQGTDGGRIEWYNATGSGIYVGEGGSLNANGLYVHDVGYAGVNSGQGTGAIKMTNCRFENTGDNGLHIKMATAELKDIEIIKPGKHGVFVNSPTTTATIENLTVTEPAERGLHNAGSTVTAKNVTVTLPGTYGVSTGNSGKTAGSLIVENLTVTGAGSNPDNSLPALNSYKSSLTVIDATITDSNNAGARVTDGGELTLKNVKIENTKSYGVYVVHNKSKATLENVSITNTAKHGVYVNNAGARADISKLTVTNAGERGIHNTDGTITAKNVTVTSPALYGVSTGNYTDKETGKSTAGSVTIDNLTVTGAKGDSAVNSYKSALTITNGKITDSVKVGARVTDGGTMKLTDVEITNTGYEGVLVSSEGKATLKNIVVTHAGKHGVYVYKANSKADIDTLNVVEPAERGLHNAGGTVNAKNVTITSSGLYGVSTGNITDAEGKVTAGSMTIDNLTVTGAKGDSAVNSYKSVLTITNGKIKDSAKVGARVTDGGTLKLTDVEISKTGTGYEGVLVTSKGQANLKNVTVTDSGKHGVYVKDADSKAAIDTLTVTKPVERGLHNAGGTITAKNVTITSPGTYGVSTGNSGESRGSLKVTNLKVTNAGAIPVVNENGSKTIQPAVNSYNSVLTVVDAKLIDSNGIGARVTDGGELNLTNVEIENAGLHGVYVVNEGSVANIDKLTVTKTGTDYNGIYVAGKGKANLSGLNTITGAGKDGICANGAGTVVSINKQEGATAEKDALTITTPVQRGIRNEGAAIVAANVTVTDPGTYGVSTAKSGDSAGSVEVDNLTVTGAGQTEKQPAVNAHNGSIMTVNGARISDCKNAGARATQGAMIVLNDVEITNVVSYGVFVQGTDSYGIINTLTVSKTENATYSSERGIYNEGGTVAATDVTIDSAKTYAVSTYRYKDADDNIIKGSVSIEGLTVTNSIAASLHVNNSELTVNVGTISDTKTHGALANYGGTLNLTDVTMDGVGKNAVYVDGATGDTTANLTRVSITNAGLHGVYVNGSGAEAYATDVTVTTTNEYTLAGDTEYGDVYVSTGGYAEMEKVSITGSKEYGIYVAGEGELNLTGVSDITDAKTAGIYVAVNSTANINAGQNDKNANNLTITGGTRGIYNVGGTVVAYHASVSDTSSYGIQTEYSGETKGRMEVNDLLVDGALGTASIYSKGSELTVTEATLKNSAGHGALINYGGILNLTDVTIDVTGNAKNGIHLDGDTGASKAYLTNLTIKDAKQYGVHAYGKDGYIKIEGLEVVKSENATYSSTRGIANKGAIIEASNVEIDSAMDYSVSSYKSSDTAKGSLEINNLKVTNSQKTSVHVNESTVTINGAELSGFTKYSVVVYSGGVLNLNDAAIDGTGEYGVFLESVYTSKISTLNMNGTNSIKNVTKAGVYVQPNTVANINHTSGTLTITDCENGIHNIGGTTNAKNLEINTPKIYGVLAEAYVDEKTQAVTNGTATIEESTIKDSVKSGAGVIGGEVLNLTTVEVHDSGEYGIYVTDEGSKVNASGLTVHTTVSGYHGVYVTNKGEANINGISNIANAGKHGVFAEGAEAKININMQEGATSDTDSLTITNATDRGIHNAGGTITAKNVTVTDPGSYGVSTGKFENSVGSVTVENLTVTGAAQTENQPGVNAHQSVLTVHGAVIKDCKNAGARVTGGGTLNLTDVQIINAGNYGLYVNNTDSVANVEGLTINTVNANDGIRVLGGATLNVNGVTSITDAKVHGIYVQVNSVANVNVALDESTNQYVGLNADTNNLTITECGERGVYIVGGTLNAANVTTNSTGAYGISLGNSGDTKATGTITNLYVNGTKKNAGVMAYKSDLTINGGTIQDTAATGATAASGGTLTMTGVKISNPKNAGVQVEANSTAWLTNITFTSCNPNMYRKVASATIYLDGVEQ